MLFPRIEWAVECACVRALLRWASRTASDCAARQWRPRETDLPLDVDSCSNGRLISSVRRKTFDRLGRDRIHLQIAFADLHGGKRWRAADWTRPTCSCDLAAPNRPLGSCAANMALGFPVTSDGERIVVTALARHKSFERRTMGWFYEHSQRLQWLEGRHPDRV
jgi:hypothetical protein